eukprot:SAG22_NODE_314_length_12607_cov_177.638311_3_plen_574_part_00
MRRGRRRRAGAARAAARRWAGGTSTSTAGGTASTPGLGLGAQAHDGPPEPGPGRDHGRDDATDARLALPRMAPAPAGAAGGVRCLGFSRAARPHLSLPSRRPLSTSWLRQRSPPASSAAAAAAAAATAAAAAAAAIVCNTRAAAEPAAPPPPLPLPLLLDAVEAKLSRIEAALGLPLPARCVHDGARPAIVMTGGPSGAGKDTLLLGAREALAADPTVEFIEREITREASKTTELEIPVTAAEFESRRAAGLYAISWEAHGGTKYGIPKASLETALAAGSTCVLNVSRTIVDEVRRDYSDRADVSFLNITASAPVLTARLQGRGRESAAEVASRVVKAKDSEPVGPHVTQVINEATKAEGVEKVVAALRGRLKYSLWLVPARGSPFDQSCEAAIGLLAAQTGATPFLPHLTLCPSFTESQLGALAIMKRTADAIHGPVEVPLSRSPASGGALISTSRAWNRALVLEAEATPELLVASAVACATVAQCDADGHLATYRPHLSLLYGVFAAERLAKLAELLEFPNVELANRVQQKPKPAPAHPVTQHASFLATEVALVMTSGPYDCWNEVGRVPL